MSSPIVSIVIVNYNSPKLIARCVDSLHQYIDVENEIIVVDNNSQEENLVDLETKYFNLKIIRLPENIGFGQANNVGVKNACGEMVLLLNSDTELFDSSINQAIQNFSTNHTTVMWGFKLLWPDGRFQNSFSSEISFLDFLLSYTHISFFEKKIKRIRTHKYTAQIINDIFKVPIVYATAILLWRNDFLTLGGFDRRYFMYFEDIDLCDRFRDVLHGEIYYYPLVSIIHNVKGSSIKNHKINWIYLKSKYIYGLRKFKFGMLPFFVIDMTLLLVAIFFRYIKRFIKIIKK